MPGPKRKQSSCNHPFSGVNSLLVSGRVSSPTGPFFGDWSYWLLMEEIPNNYLGWFIPLKSNIDTQNNAMFEAVSIHFPFGPPIILGIDFGGGSSPPFVPKELLFFKNTLEDLNGRCPKNSQVQQSWWDVLQKKLRQELGEHKNNGSKLSASLGGGFHLFFIAIFWGNDPIWRAYFSDGLKSPTSQWFKLGWDMFDLKSIDL